MNERIYCASIDADLMLSADGPKNGPHFVPNECGSLVNAGSFLVTVEFDNGDSFQLSKGDKCAVPSGSMMFHVYPVVANTSA